MKGGTNMKYSELIQQADDYARCGLIVEAIRILTVVRTDMERALVEIEEAKNLSYQEQTIQIIRDSIESVKTRIAEIKKAF